MTPTRVARHLGRSLQMNPDSVRYFTRKGAKELESQAGADNKPETSRRQQLAPVSREAWGELHCQESVVVAEAFQRLFRGAGDARFTRAPGAALWRLFA